MSATTQKIEQLRRLISQTHNHGVTLKREIEGLEKSGDKHGPKLLAKKALLKGLEVLNARRRKELAKLEQSLKPTPPKPTPAPPKPAPKPASRFTMYDSTNVGNIPHNPEAVAGYVDGLFANFNEMVKSFPRAKHLSIAVNSSTDADALDVENGDAIPGEAPPWIRKQHARGVKLPIVYCNTSTLPQVLQACKDALILRESFMIWTAHYTGDAHIEPGSDATQYEDHDELYDVSLCEPYFL